SVVGLWLLSRKYLEQWLVWIAVDVVCAVLYLQKDLAPTGWLYALYTIIAIFGYYKWRKMMRDDTKK
ncbi:MAG: nicotinamide riboside transporter PnuC, partial [Mucinivorans sp.]